MTGWRRGPSHRPRSVRCPETDALAPRPLPVRSAQTVLRGRTCSRAHRVRVRIKGLVPALQPVLVTQGFAGYNGILWVFMGRSWKTADYCDFQWAAKARCSRPVLALNPVDKSV